MSLNKLIVGLIAVIVLMGDIGCRDIGKRYVDSVDAVDDNEDMVEDRLEAESADNLDESRRPTNVIIRESYVDCVNINSDVDKLSANFQVISNESCLTMYRFAAYEITYDVLFKTGATAKTQIHLELQDSERTSDSITVTLTGKVVDGYMKGAHYQSVTVYPVLNDNHCLTEPGITELRSSSASVTFILLPTPSSSTETSELSPRVVTRYPEAFDCFGSASMDYNPGLIDLKHILSDESDD